MDVVTFHSVWTAVLLVIFVGIVGWVFVLRRKSDFDEAARLPLEDDAGGANRKNVDG